MNHHEMPDPLKQQLAAHWDAFMSLAEPELEPDSCREEILSVWQLSEFSIQTSMRQAAWLLNSLQESAFKLPYNRDLLQTFIRQALQDVSSEAELMRQLRILRQQQMLRIVWREMRYEAVLEETLMATSDLADLLINAALGWLYDDAVERSGHPCNAQGEIQNLIVLGMGKLGGRELNFSSDIDLIFAFPDKGETDADKPQANELFFTRLGQRLIKVLDQVTADGFVYRVDMRLRPFGDSGALVQHFDGMEHYYEVHGREWERYALIKARPVAGDLQAGSSLLKRLRGFIYRRYLDYGVIEALRDMKAMIARQAAVRGKEQDLKLGPGGIREIEFIVQMFQLIHGGRHRQLQQQSLLPSLAYIKTQNWLSDDEADSLERAYRFLRQAENHIQMQNDRQIHKLPQETIACWRLTQSLGCVDWRALISMLDGHREKVMDMFHETFNVSASTEEEEISPQVETVWEAMCHEDETALETAIRDTGLDDTELAYRALHDFMQVRQVKTLSEKGRLRLNKLMPLLLADIFQAELPGKTISRLLGLVSKIAQRSSYIAFLAERPQTLQLLVKLCNTSDWITDYLTRHPMLLDELLDPVTLLAPPDRAGLEQQMTEAMAQIDPEDQEAWLDQLRHFKQTQVLRVAAADVMNALPLMHVSDQLTWIAEVVLENVLDKVWRELVRKHGEPLQGDGDQKAEFSIIGYGKMGGLEMSYGSDLDLVFLHNANNEASTNGERPQPVGQFFARLGQRIINVLNTFTTAGTLYEVDMRLRPSGNAGLLVSNLEAFRHYQIEQAWLWEHQALIRARPVAGSATIALAFNEIRSEVLTQSRTASEVAVEVLGMRRKMWQSQTTTEKFDLKKSPGGITDIEFMVQYLVLAHAHEKQQLVDWTDNIRILETLAETRVIKPATAQRLTDIYRQLRDTIHHLTLRGKDPAVDDSLFRDERGFVIDCWQAWLDKT